MTTDTKNERFAEIRERLEKEGFRIVAKDSDRPWGGFFVIDEDQAADFIDHYFEDVTMSEANISGKLSPKILLVQPGKRLSWQYHHRRAELWQVVEGPVGVIRSHTDEQGEVQTYEAGDLITLEQGERHRLVGLDSWGVIAEIWQHVDAEHPSNEEDIIRLQDDFGR